MDTFIVDTKFRLVEYSLDSESRKAAGAYAKRAKAAVDGGKRQGRSTTYRIG